MSEKKRVMSGMRPTSRIHLGHYLGVLTSWKELQDDYECYFSVADWHALTTGYDKTEYLKENVLNVVVDWLACGINPEKATIYVQSSIPEIAELNVYLSMLAPKNWIERDAAIKSKIKYFNTNKRKSSQISFGLMGYPILMSADIMAVNAHYVPVGAYHVPEVELARDMVRRFNKVYNTDYFVEPQPKLSEYSLLCGVDGKKMGKSFNNAINLSDSEEITEKKIMQCITDRSRAKKDDKGHPEKCEVAFKYWQLFASNDEILNVEKECRAGERGCANCKRQLAKKVNEALLDIRENRKYYENHIDEVEEILRAGCEKSRNLSKKILTDVRNIVGMY